jgi:hypothetical protein
MPNKGLLIALVVLAGLAGGVWYSNKLEAEKEGKPPADSSPKLIEVAEDQIVKLEIAKAGMAPVVLERGSSSGWTITAPEKLPADEDSVSSMTSTLATFGSDRLVEEKAGDVTSFGLAAPALTIAVTTKDGKTRKLLIGEETPTGGGFYAKLDGDPRVFTIYSYNRSAVDKTWPDLRDKRLLTVKPDQISRVELTAKGQTIEFGKSTGGDWQILRPGPFRADNVQVDEIVRKLQDAKMDVTIPADEAAKAPALFGSGSLVAIAKVTDSAGAQTIEIRRNKDDYYAKGSAVAGIYKIATDSAEGLDKSADELRNKKLFDFGFSEPDRVEVRDGSAATVLTKSGENWQRGGKNLDSPSVSQLVDQLRDLQAIKFKTEGFTSPAIEFTVVSNAGKRTEKVEIAQSGVYWIARRSGEPALYELDGKAIDEIRQAVKDLKEAAPPAKK